MGGAHPGELGAAADRGAAGWADAEFRVGGHTEVIATPTSLVAEAPLVEPLTVALMRALRAA